MKKLSLLLAIMAIVFAAHAKPNSLTGNKPENAPKWTIEKAADQIEGSETRNVWTINYLESEKSVQVVKHATKKGFEYAVHSEFFDICYENLKNRFGVKYLKKSLCKTDDQITRKVIDGDKMGRQKILSNRQVDDQTAIELIAAYLPELLGENYTFLLQ